MSDNSLNTIFNGFDGEIIDIKLAINDVNKPSQDDIIKQMKNIIEAYGQGQTTEFVDY
ncbi:MAG: hypothetical protein M0R47_19760 [Methylobacter sp.]|uniref:hypothetical protein n=1 Tax=Methylobacter sp. TaxID=2051955 RepID=UPI0025D81EA7|nr:hypothetical protein [Methylobacter sp.]MCK9622758.1 hypothetical protein [Methylobacter sp.]